MENIGGRSAQNWWRVGLGGGTCLGYGLGWMLGFAATGVGWVLFVQATALGDISLVQPLMSAGDLLLVILAVVFLKERLGGLEWAGVLLTLLGAAALAWEAEDSHVANFGGTRLLVLLGCLVLSSVALLLANRRSQRPEIFLALVVGMCFGAGSVLTKAMTVADVGSGKTVMTWTILIDPLLLAFFLANAFGLVLLQAVFQGGRAAVIVPLQLSMANAITVLAGVAIFAEHTTAARAACIIIMIIRGTALLRVKPQPAA